MRCLSLLAICGAALFLTGCPPRGCATFQNRTGEAITVHYADKTISVTADDSNTICGYVWPDTFEIDTAHKAWQYSHPYVGQEFMYPTFDVVLLVDHDGRVYAQQPREAKRKFSAQPPGYPLRPKT